MAPEPQAVQLLRLHKRSRLHALRARGHLHLDVGLRRCWNHLRVQVLPPEREREDEPGADPVDSLHDHHKDVHRHRPVLAVPTAVRRRARGLHHLNVLQAASEICDFEGKDRKRENTMQS